MAIIKLFLLTICSLGFLGVNAQSKSPCYYYESDTINLTGEMVRDTFPGPPNYESIKEGDAAEIYWVLQLEKPICMNAVADDDNNVDRQNVTQLQMVMDIDMYKKYRELLYKTVTVKGTLFGAQTGHHHTDVLITVISIK
jgi:hypothetical protein